MGFEIERKFLVRGNAWNNLVMRYFSIRQAYLSLEGKASVRVRIQDDRIALLSIKSRPIAVRRLELEYSIPIADAEALMQLRCGSVINKIRHVVPWHDLNWEIDVFLGENSGLTIAEIELDHEHRNIELPNWIGKEVTGQTQYYNGCLVQHPFCSWPPSEETSDGIAALCQ